MAEFPVLFNIWNGQQRVAAIEEILALQLGTHKVMVAPITAEDVLRRKFHAMCGDVTKQQRAFAARMLAAQQWKTLLISGHAVAQNQPSEIISGLEHELVDIRESTTQMSGPRMRSCIEYVRAWGEERSIIWTEPKDQFNQRGA